jgi:hypothetical protein
MPGKAEVRGIEGGSCGDQLARLLLRPLPEPQGDDQPLHRLPLSGFLFGAAPNTIEPILGFTGVELKLGDDLRALVIPQLAGIIGVDSHRFPARTRTRL